MNGEYDGAQDYDFVLRCVRRPIRSGIYRKSYITGEHAKDLQQAVQTINPILWMQVQKRLRAHYRRMGIGSRSHSNEVSGNVPDKISGETNA